MSMLSFIAESLWSLTTWGIVGIILSVNLNKKNTLGFIGEVFNTRIVTPRGLFMPPINIV